MKKASTYHKMLVLMWGMVYLFIFTLPAQAANRNDLLFNLKDTFNNPISDKISMATIIVILVLCALLLVAISFDSARKKNALQASRELHLQRVGSEKSSNQQKRNWFRLRTNAEFEWLPNDKNLIESSKKYNIDHLIDLSGGGLSFETNKAINPGDEIVLLLSIGERTPLSLIGQVVRVEGEATRTVSIKFIGIRDGQRDRIVSWILNNQRNVIQEEKLDDDNSSDA